MSNAGAELGRVLASYVDPEWYLRQYRDVAAAGLDPARHFMEAGAAEGRDPNRFFDGRWYREHYPDVGDTVPLLHYMLTGAVQHRQPHPHFDVQYYVQAHPEAAANPLLFHLSVGRARGYATARPFRIDEYLPSQAPPLACPAQVVADVIIPVYRGLAETRRCLGSVLADRAPPLGRVIVVEDRSPEADLVAWLQQLAAEGHITLLRNRRNLGFVASVNRGMVAAGAHDVVLLNSDTEVPRGWLARLAAQAHAAPRIASVSPFSNNATICGYPDDQGGAPAFGHDLAQLDDTCRTVNAGRSVEVPTTVGFCMYIRRDALNEVGLFDAERFGHGYGEENDFCLRASARGWRHRLACDTFVFHAGQVSFGSRKDALARRAMTLILERFPDYEARVAGHVRRGLSTPARFAVTAALLRQSQAPVILMVTHNLGGGIRHHINRLVERYRTTARILLLEGTSRTVRLSVPALPGHPPLDLAGGQLDELEALLRSMAVSRVHVHHLLKFGLNVRALIRRLGVGFDLTVHDYYGICPQRNLLPWEEGFSCREPGPATCNACITDASDLEHGARDILSWRLEHAWQFREADRVICPSEDVRRRLQRYGLAERVVTVPHEGTAPAHSPVAIPVPAGSALRVVLLGVLAGLKGARVAAAVAGAVPRARIAFHLIGHTDGNYPDWALDRITQTGAYEEAELPALIRQADPHVFWFPSTAPETYSYALTAAIETGLPIVATHLGAFPERLSGRPLTWLVADNATTDELIAVFEEIRRTLAAGSIGPACPPPPPATDFYDTTYLGFAAHRAPAPERPVVLALPARTDHGTFSDSAYTRLLLPLDHPGAAQICQLVLGDWQTVTDMQARAIVLQPAALPNRAAAEALLEQARSKGIRLAIDLNEQADGFDPTTALLLKAADVVWTAVPTAHEKAIVIPTRLDERIWQPASPANQWDDPLHLVWFGSPDEADDLALIVPALTALKQCYGERIAIDILGLPPTVSLPEGMTPVRPPALALRAYPAFVHWLLGMAPGFHIGLAPLRDTGRGRTSLRAAAFAALGIPVLASDVPAYRGSPADGIAGRLVPNTPGAWYAAIDWMIRTQTVREALAAQARPAFESGCTLASAGTLWSAALRNLLDAGRPARSVLRAKSRRLHSGHELSGAASRAGSHRGGG